MVIEENNISIKDVDRPLMIINDCIIKGTTRFQKYGFILHKQYDSDMKALNKRYNIKFYADWKPYYFGPFSRSLADDLKKCIDSKIITKVDIPTASEGKKVSMYNLTIKGKFKWRRLIINVPEVSRFVKKIQSVQKVPYYTLLGQIYATYPEFTTKSRIRDDVATNANY